MRYSVQPRYQLFVKVYRFLSFDKNIGKNMSKNLSGKYSQKILDHVKKPATDPPKTFSQRVIQKTAEAYGDLIDNEIVNKITGFAKNLQQNNLDTVANEHDKEILKERYISPEERQEIIDELRLKEYDNVISKNNTSFKKFTTK